MRQLLLVLYAVFALAASAAFARNEQPAGTQPAADTSVPQPAATGTRDPRAYFTDADLVTQNGQKVKFYSDMLKGKVAVVNVMYASCTDACPLITRQLNQVREDLGPLFGNKVFFVSISSDPVRDTPQALKKFAQKQSADVAGWTFLTGSKNNIDVILKRMRAWNENVEEHATVLYILDVDRKRMRKMLPNLPPKAIAEAARLIAATDNNPVASTRPHAN
jgi:cytochrome oxidase Cu insertion factor (SCO1/SenC/PrrC family)